MDHNINDMITNNVIYTLIFFVIIGVILYVYLNRNTDDSEICTSDKKSCLIKPKNKRKRGRKKVRFDDEPKYHYYDNPTKLNSKGAPSSLAKEIRPFQENSIDVDKVLHKNQSSEKASEISEEDITSDYYSDRKPTFNVDASNMEMQNNNWDSSFGVPLVNKDERKEHFDRVQKSNKRYDKSIGDFISYQTDKSSVVEPEFKIDPFKPSKQMKDLRSKTVREIYDMQVQTPTAKPKKVKNKSLGVTYYEDENENNGGMIKGTHLHGSRGGHHVETYEKASFGNQF